MADIKEQLHKLMLRPGFQACSDQETLMDSVNEIEQLRAALRRIGEMVDRDWPGGEIKACIKDALGDNA